VPSEQPTVIAAKVQITDSDFSLYARHPTRRPWAEIPPEDQSAYGDLRQRLKLLTEEVAAKYPARTPLRAFQSHHVPNGRNSTDIWCCVFPKAAPNKSFALQYALIVSANAVEICFCLGAGTAQVDPQVQSGFRAEFFRMRANLASLNADQVQKIDAELKRSGWNYRRSWRMPAGTTDFATLQEWLRFATSPQGDGASISRNLSPQESQALGDRLSQQFYDWGVVFSSLFDVAYGEAVALSDVRHSDSSVATIAVSDVTQQRKRVWVIAPGERARLWPDFVREQIAAIGWDDLGDLRQYSSKHVLAEKIREVYARDNAPTNDAQACFEFSQVMQPGDLVFAKQGVRTLAGC